MAMQMEKSGEWMMLRGIQDELDDQKEWKTRRRKLAAFLLAIAAVTAAVFVGPHVPGFEIISNALKTVVAAIW